jgi:hypothetical protein
MSFQAASISSSRKRFCKPSLGASCAITSFTLTVRSGVGSGSETPLHSARTCSRSVLFNRIRLALLVQRLAFGASHAARYLGLLVLVTVRIGLVLIGDCLLQVRCRPRKRRTPNAYLRSVAPDSLYWTPFHCLFAKTFFLWALWLLKDV